MSDKSKKFVEGQVLVLWNESASEDSRRDTLEQLGLEHVYDFRAKRCLVRVPVGEESVWVTKLAAEETVKVADLNHIVTHA